MYLREMMGGALIGALISWLSMRWAARKAVECCPHCGHMLYRKGD